MEGTFKGSGTQMVVEAGGSGKQQGPPWGARSFPEHCIRTDGQTVKAVSDPCRSGTRMTAGPPPRPPSRPCCVSLLCPQAALPAAPACSFSVETNCQEHTITQLLYGQAGGFSLILRHPPHSVLQAPGFKPCQGRAVGGVQKPRCESSSATVRLERGLGSMETTPLCSRVCGNGDLEGHRDSAGLPPSQREVQTGLLL